MESSSYVYKTEGQKQLLRSEQFELPIVYGTGLPLMQPKLTSILERLEKVPDLQTLYRGELGLGHIR